MISASIPLRIKVLQFLGGFLGWFFVAGIGPIRLMRAGCEDLLCLSYLLMYAGFTFLLTVSLVIFFLCFCSVSQPRVPPG
jgi:hypothetical protein